MANPTSNELRTALSLDLKKTVSKGMGKVINDAARKTFTAKIDGVILEFAHKQPDVGYWNGVKYYGSGSNSRIRIRRTPPVVVAAAEKNN